MAAAATAAAAALTSNFFILTSGSSRSTKSRGLPFAQPKISSATVSAKQNTLGFDRRKDKDSSEIDQENGEATTTTPFFLDFRKLKNVTEALVPARRKDPRTVYVAGATGQTGVRIARTLLREGFAVRAGVPDLDAAQELARLAVTYKIITPAESRRLNAVESSSGEPESIAKAIGNASKVVVTVGLSENGPSSEISTDDALSVVRAAQLAGAAHVAIVFNLSENGSVGGNSTYNVLDGITSFFRNLFARSQPLTVGEFLDKVAEETEIRYTLIKSFLSDDDYSDVSSGGLVVSPEGGGIAVGPPVKLKVPRSKIATLVANVFADSSFAENKVVEVSSSSSAPPKLMAELFSAIPEDGRRKAFSEARARSLDEEETLELSKQIRRPAALRLEEEQKNFSNQETYNSPAARSLWEKASKNFQGDFISWNKSGSKISSSFSAAFNTSDVDDGDRGPAAAQVATIRGQAKARSLPAKKAVVKRSAVVAAKKEKVEERNIFGGLFKQEIVYVDDD